ncbi:MAG: hypothetical protein LQ346_008947, partial [Caloplaca aetnensis]
MPRQSMQPPFAPLPIHGNARSRNLSIPVRFSSHLALATSSAWDALLFEGVESSWGSRGTQAYPLVFQVLTIPRIYGQIGPGERIALSKLAVEHFEKHGRPMRIAIDASIWHFQTQAGQGGSNPALRTLYYRLIRLLSLSIRPFFIFDGPNKPPFKRNVKTGNLGAQLPNFITKQLLDLFGFPYHTAPGEAEAECTLLQKEGIVDAVLSEDVDTMMFGCTVHLRNWSSENVRGSKSPTHVNLYRAEATKQGKSGLDSDGMILIALMSGGDYVPAGVPGCGIKIACEAARAGFGRDLCRLQRNDTVGFNQWRERLQYELHVNESGFFRTRHKALAIPDNFPDRKVLGYYTNPCVSNTLQLTRLRTSIIWDGDINILALRQFVADAFEWQNLAGAKKLIRTLAPAMLVDQLCRRYGVDQVSDDSKARESEEAKLVTAICGRRSHWITDAVPELRIAYTPIDVVGIDLDSEEPDAEIAVLSESEPEIQAETAESRSGSPTKRAVSTYDPTQPEKIWVLESYTKIGIPLMVENWEEAMKDPKKFATRKARERATVSKKSKKPEIMKPGSMHAFVKTLKPGIDRSRAVERPALRGEPDPSLLVADGASLVKEWGMESQIRKAPQITQHSAPSTPKKAASGRISKPSLKKMPTVVDKSINPWTMAKRPPETLNTRLRPGTRFSALGIYGPPLDETSPHSEEQRQNDKFEDSQQLSAPSPSRSRRRRSTSDPGQVQSPEESSIGRANRESDFTIGSSPTEEFRPDTPDSLPSPSTLMSRRKEQSWNTETQKVMSSSQRDTSNPGVKRAKALLALRESLDGAWRAIEPWERDRAYIKITYEQ